MKDGRRLSSEYEVKPYTCLVLCWWILLNCVLYSITDTSVNRRLNYEASRRSRWILILIFILLCHEETDTAPFLAPQYDNNPTPLINVRILSLCVTLHTFPDHFQRNTIFCILISPSNQAFIILFFTFYEMLIHFFPIRLPNVQDIQTSFMNVISMMF
jgi:hypothetical protein